MPHHHRAAPHRPVLGVTRAVVHVAELDGEVVGCTLWSRTSPPLDSQHGLYLEDLYVRPNARSTGLGRALLATLAAECVQQGYTRLQWWVLDWNEPAIGLYESYGAAPMDDWTVFRLSGAALHRLAET
jgi:GNAT superfamily N-acetyltransferase